MFNFKEIKLSKEKHEFLYLQLYKEIKKLIMDKKIQPHTKLPPIREMSKILGVNNITIVNAYNLLENDGFVYKKIGSGTYINELKAKKNVANGLLIDSEENVFQNEINENDRKQSLKSKGIIDFASGVPTPDLFPVDDFKVVLNEILDRDKGNAFGYQESQGFYQLRHTIKKYLSKYNINTSIDNIQIISGAQQGIDILSKTLIDYGDVVFTESPTYAGAIAAFKSRSARIVEIPILKDGIDIKTLENKLKVFTPKFIYVMTNYQNPTGFTYSIEKRKRLLELANLHNFFIIEDDYLSDLSFFQKNLYSLKSMDLEDKVIYVKSFSKIFMPGLRLAFMIIPLSIYNDVLSAKHTTDISTSSLIQRAFDLYLKKGIWEKHIKFMKMVYENRFNTMTKSLKVFMPKEISYINPKGGLNFWLSLPSGYSSSELYKLCLQHNILIVPGSAFFVDQKDNEYFRLNIASVYNNEFQIGIKKLSDIIREFLKDYSKNKIKPFNQLL